MNWLHYLLEANIYLAVFYACYCLFLNKETYYTLNRVYLLLTCILSFILPVIQIGVLKTAEKLPELTPVSYNVTAQNVQLISKLAKQPTVIHQITLNDVLWAVYIVGIAVLTLLLVIKLFRVINMTTSGKTLINNRYKLIDVEDTDTAFSFFNYLFIGTKTTGNDIIIQHELVHIRQKHSFDIIFIEIIKIINWFNPVIYLLQISLKTIHEYIADEQTAALDHDALAYSAFLVDNAYGLNGSSITHSFFNYNLLKKRIIMLNQKRSGRLARLKYLVAIPVFGGMLCASTLAFSKNYALIDLAPKHTVALKTVASKTPKTAADTLSRSQVKSRAVTTKGYKYEETGYLVNNKADFRVVITDKNGEQKEYYKSKANGTELAMLQEKYGYTFPKMLIFPKMPPPPPAPPVAAVPHKNLHRLPPPPPAPPVASVDVKMPPPPPPAAPVKSKLKGKTPPPPPAPPVSSADYKTPPPPTPPLGAVGLPLPPLPPLKLKKDKKWAPAVAPTPDVKPADTEPAVSPTEPAATPDVKPAAASPTAKVKAKIKAEINEQLNNG